MLPLRLPMQAFFIAKNPDTRIVALQATIFTGNIGITVIEPG